MVRAPKKKVRSFVKRRCSPRSSRLLAKSIKPSIEDARQMRRSDFPRTRSRAEDSGIDNAHRIALELIRADSPIP